MGAYEGAGITVLAKGVKLPAGSESFASDTFPTGTTLLTTTLIAGLPTNPANPFPSNFQCNPSSIDGLGITNSSQGGGGIFVHAWGHNLQIANNRVYNNPERSRAASTSARVNLPPRTSGRRGGQRGSGLLPRTSNVTNRSCRTALT
jgi:hypothetical protein